MVGQPYNSIQSYILIDVRRNCNSIKNFHMGYSKEKVGKMKRVYCT